MGVRKEARREDGGSAGGMIEGWWEYREKEEGGGGNSSGKDGGGTCHALFYSHPGVSERRQIPADYSVVLSNTKRKGEKKKKVLLFVSLPC